MTFRLDYKRQLRIEAGRRAFELIATGMTMNAVVAEVCSNVGMFKEKRSRAWIYRAMAEAHAEDSDNLRHNVTAQTDINCQVPAGTIESDPLLD